MVLGYFLRIGMHTLADISIAPAVRRGAEVADVGLALLFWRPRRDSCALESGLRVLDLAPLVVEQRFLAYGSCNPRHNDQPLSLLLAGGTGSGGYQGTSRNGSHSRGIPNKDLQP